MKKVLALVLDAAEPALLEQWIQDGSLPNLRTLKESGKYGKLTSVAEHMSEAVPYTFYSGRNPASHGAHGFATWRAETQQFQPPGPDWLPILPFWRSFQQGGPRAIVLDVSNVYPPTPFNGIEITGWASHDSLVPFTVYPEAMKDRIRSTYGSSLLPDELYGLMTRRDFVEARDLMFEISETFANLCIDLLQHESWDFFLGYIFTLHHAGHRLWNTVNISEPLDEAEKAEFEKTLHQVYMACDRTVGEILNAAGPDVTIMVMSMHGMGVNRSRTWILPEMLKLVLKDEKMQTGFSRILRAMRSLIPVHWRHEIKSRLPFNIRRGLTRYWRSGYDWNRTKAFTLLSDTHGWIRVNLKGREARGIVEPGDYEAVLKEIEDGLRTFVDADTGEPVIKQVIRPADHFSGNNLNRLPDLVIHWADSPAANHWVVTSPAFGSIPWPTPGRNPEGRSGNHRAEGFLMVHGPGISPGSLGPAHILDLAPTILNLLGQPVPSEMEGRPLDLKGGHWV